MCTTHGECRLISIRRQKECLDSNLVISCRMMHNFIKYKMWFKSYKHFRELQMYARTDSHRDHSNSAHLWVVEFFSSLCSFSRRNQYTCITVKTQKISKETNRKNNNKNSIEIAIFKFTDLTYYKVNIIIPLLLIRFGIISQLTAFFSFSDET